MAKRDTTTHDESNLSVGSMASPSWLPAGKPRGGGRFQVLARGGRWWCGQRAWRKLVRRLVQESKCICSHPAATRPITFGYDAASYAKNFDDGRRPVHYIAAVVANAAGKQSSAAR